MTKGENSVQTKTEELPIRNSNGTNSSNPASTIPHINSGESNSDIPLHSNNNDITTASVARTGNSQAKKKRKSQIPRLQTIGLIITIIAIPLVYWQGRMQASQSKFERNQRVVELSLN